MVHVVKVVNTHIDVGPRSQRWSLRSIFDFHRPNKPKFDHFTTEQEELVITAIKHVSQQLYNMLGTTYNIEEYISTHQ